MSVAADEDGVGGVGGGNGVEDALARCGVTIPAIGPVATFAFAIFLTQLGDKLFLRDDVPGSVGLLEAIKQPLLLLGAQQRSIRIQALSTTIRGDVTSAQRRHLAGLFGSVLTAIQDREGHEVPKSEALIKAQCAALRYRPRA